MKKTLPHYIEIGRLYKLAKEAAGHKNFVKWCRDNTTYSRTSVKRFMRIYRNADKLYKAKGPEMALLKIATADKLISDARGRKGTKRKPTTAEEKAEALGLLKTDPEAPATSTSGTESDTATDPEAGVIGIGQDNEIIVDPDPQEVQTETQSDTANNPDAHDPETGVVGIGKGGKIIVHSGSQEETTESKVPTSSKRTKAVTPEEKANETLATLYRAIDEVVEIDPQAMAWDAQNRKQLIDELNDRFRILENWIETVKAA